MPFPTQNIWTSPQLPTLTTVGKKVLEQSRRPATTPHELAQLFRTEPAFAANLIAVTNSPFCALALKVLSAEQAISALGVTHVTALALNLTLIETYQAEAASGANRLPNGLDTTESDGKIDVKLLFESRDQFWRKALVKAIAAELLCRQVQDGLECEYFLAGLSLDLGRFALLRTAPQEFLSILASVRESRRPAADCERALLGVTAAELGGLLLEKWGFPKRLVQGIQLQHASVAAFKELESQAECSLSGALALATAIGDYLCDQQQAVSLFRIRELTASLIPLRESELDSLMAAIVTRFNAIAPVFSAGKELSHVYEFASLSELKARAIQQLTELDGRSTDMEVRTERGLSQLPSAIERRGFPTDARSNLSRSVHDPLTQVFNREFFDAALQKEVQRCCQVAAPLGIAVVHVDCMTKMSERLGAEAGNGVLKRIGGILKDLMRSSDTVARVDQQFLILASTPTSKGMQKLADRIRARVENEQLVWEGQKKPITVSVGACLALPGRLDLEIGEKVVSSAQEAAKEAAFGEGNNSYFSSLVDETELNRLFMANQMRFSRWLVSEGVLDIPRVAKALLSFNQRTLPLGDLAVRQELLSSLQVQEVLALQEESNARFGAIAVDRTYLSEEQLTGLLILQQEDPILVASLFLKLSLLEPQRLKVLLRNYFDIVPWAAPLYPTAGRG